MLVIGGQVLKLSPAPSLRVSRKVEQNSVVGLRLCTWYEMQWPKDWPTHCIRCLPTNSFFFLTENNVLLGMSHTFWGLLSSVEKLFYIALYKMIIFIVQDVCILSCKANIFYIIFKRFLFLTLFTWLRVVHTHVGLQSGWGGSRHERRWVGLSPAL